VAAAREARANSDGALHVTFDLTGRSLRARATCAGVSFDVTRPLPGA
jgi:hypothetical protein